LVEGDEDDRSLSMLEDDEDSEAKKKGILRSSQSMFIMRKVSRWRCEEGMRAKRAIESRENRRVT
jgi:hypothetical protein